MISAKKMPSFLEEAREEIKRADHLFYVSLKYTRTVDVLKSLIGRLVSAIDALINHLLDYAVDKKMITEKPDNLGLRGDLVKKIFKDQTVNEMVDFSLYMKMINRANYTRSREFRRHVTMSAVTDKGIVNIDIDTIKEDYIKTKGYLQYVEQMIYGEQEHHT